MVATAGVGWRLASSLDALIDETDRLYPNRDHTSDGSIGDASHAARESDHNPDDGWVCAVDIDEDLSSTVHTIARLAEHLIDDRDHRVKYLIYEGWICKAYVDSAGHPAWRWYPYTGLNDHSHHLHVSCWNTSAARDDRGPWWPQAEPKPTPLPQEDDDMAFTLISPTSGQTWLIEPGAMTLVPADDHDNVAKLPALGKVSARLFERIDASHKRYEA